MKKTTMLVLLLGLAFAGLLGATIFFARPYIGLVIGKFSPRPATPKPAPLEIIPVARPAPPPPPPEPEPSEKPAPPIPTKVDTPPPAPPPEPAGTIDKAQKDADAELERRVTELYPLPRVRPLEEIVDHWENVPRHAFPKSVTIDNPLEFKLLHNGVAIGGKSLPAGAHVIPIELQGTALIVAPDVGTSMRAEVPVDETNFKNLIHARYMDFIQKQNAEVMTARAAEIARLRKSQALETALSDYNDGSDPRFDPMKASLKNGEAGTFDLEYATQWRWLGTEEIDGASYDIGIAVFETESAFGVSRTEIKALMRDGKVDRWVNAASGEDL